MSAPVSRFWACFFAPSIFALLWTRKMKKTRRWISIVAPIYAAPYFVPILSVLAAASTGSLEASRSWLLAVQDATVFLWLALCAVPVWAMLGWATGYNLRNFGARSKKDLRGSEGRV